MTTWGRSVLKVYLPTTQQPELNPHHVFCLTFFLRIKVDILYLQTAQDVPFSLFKAIMLHVSSVLWL